MNTTATDHRIIHRAVRWRRDGRVVTRCRDVTTHSASTTDDAAVTCTQCRVA